MKILKLNNFEYTQTAFMQNNKKADDKMRKSEYAGIALIVTGTVALSGVIFAKRKPDKYILNLAKDLSTELKTKIKPSDLKSIITKQEFNKIAKTLKEENYISTPENIKNGIFRADFHSHSNYSDGASTVEEILNQAAEYGNQLHKINGKKFLFALSDHDGVEGVKEALKIIAKNPEKYENIRFIPAAELSMPIHCENGSFKNSRFHNDVEMSEMLIYCINPFSDTSNKYFSNLYKKRKEGIIESLKEAAKIIPNIEFSEEEFNKFFTRDKVPYCMLNQHWRIFQYVNLKTRISQVAQEQNKNPKELYLSIMQELKNIGGFDGQTLDKYLKQNNIPNTTKTYIDEMSKIKYEICPTYKGPVLWAPYENSFQTIVEYADKENAVLAFAHPVFTVQNMRKENVSKNIKEYIEKSRGRLIYAETYHQAYPSNTIKSEINFTNQIMNEAGLINIGGRDSHKNNFKF